MSNQSTKKTFRIPFSQEEYKSIDEMKEKLFLKKTSLITQILLTELQEFEKRNQFGISLNFNRNKNIIVDPNYVQVYLKQADYEQIKYWSEITGISVPCFARYLIVPAISGRQKGETNDFLHSVTNL